MIAISFWLISFFPVVQSASCDWKRVRYPGSQISASLNHCECRTGEGATDGTSSMCSAQPREGTPIPSGTTQDKQNTWKEANLLQPEAVESSPQSTCSSGPKKAVQLFQCRTFSVAEQRSLRKKETFTGIYILFNVALGSSKRDCSSTSFFLFWKMRLQEGFWDEGRIDDAPRGRPHRRTSEEEDLFIVAAIRDHLFMAIKELKGCLNIRA